MRVHKTLIPHMRMRARALSPSLPQTRMRACVLLCVRVFARVCGLLRVYDAKETYHIAKETYYQAKETYSTPHT